MHPIMSKDNQRLPKTAKARLVFPDAGSNLFMTGWILNWTLGSVQQKFWTLNWTLSSVQEVQVQTLVQNRTSATLPCLWQETLSLQVWPCMMQSHTISTHCKSLNLVEEILTVPYFNLIWKHVKWRKLVFKSLVKSGYWVPNMVTETLTG